jgi:hypothetical protein
MTEIIECQTDTSFKMFWEVKVDLEFVYRILASLSSHLSMIRNLIFFPTVDPLYKVDVSKTASVV